MSKSKYHSSITFYENIFDYGNRKSDSIWVQIESLLAERTGFARSVGTPTRRISGSDGKAKRSVGYFEDAVFIAKNKPLLIKERVVFFAKSKKQAFRKKQKGITHRICKERGFSTRRISERRMPKRHVISVFRNLYDKSPLHLKKEFFRLFTKKDKKKLRYKGVTELLAERTGFARSVGNTHATD